MGWGTGHTFCGPVCNRGRIVHVVAYGRHHGSRCRFALSPLDSAPPHLWRGLIPLGRHLYRCHFTAPHALVHGHQHVAIPGWILSSYTHLWQPWPMDSLPVVSGMPWHGTDSDTRKDFAVNKWHHNSPCCFGSVGENLYICKKKRVNYMT